MRAPRPPILGADIWTTVVTRYEYRCSCTGQCGAGHTKSAGRCAHLHRETGRREDRLVAVPEDPAVTGIAAARLPAAELVARCHDCQADLQRIAGRAAKAARADATSALFDVDALGGAS
ncbi:hypothetical protein [Embleya sp. NPDC001921]